MQPQEPSYRPILSGAEAKRLLTKSDPDYGKDFSQAEWEDIAMRLVRMTRLITNIHQRKTDEKAGRIAPAGEKLPPPDVR